ncbi:MAG: Fe-S protein assembly co-chaperone HscB [Neisseriaceae bacterium]
MENTADHLKSLLDLDYFSLFAIDPTFDIDQDTLKSKYIELQKKFHPDNFIDINILERVEHTNLKSFFSILSAHINSGYNTLKNPLFRGLLLLKHNKISCDLSTNSELPKDFLLQQMEFHDNIQHAKETNNIVALELLENDLIKLEQDLFLKLKQMFANKDYLNACKHIKQLNFYGRLKNTISDLLI